MKKIISILMVAVMVLGLLPVTSFATESDFNVIEPDTWYSILLPENPSTELENAANELQFFVEEITGVHLDILNDDGAMTADTEYISLGNTSVFSESGYSIEGLEAEASVVKTYSVSILLYGGSDVGVTYAVYELLEHWFDLKFYTPDCYTYTAKETVAFEELDLTSTPAVDYRTVGMYLTWYSGWTNLRRMRVSNTSEYMNGLGHSIANLLPPATYYAEHPEWYSNYANGQVDNWQVCLSNAEMRAQLIANVKAKLASNSSLKYFSVGQNDGDGFCTCDNCKALNLQYSVNADAYSGAWLAMVNEVAAACAEEYPDVIFYMLAYTNRTDAAPTKNITANDNVGVMYAPIDGQRTTSYFNGTGEYSYSNGRVTKNINAWTQLTDHFMMWSYAAQFGDAMVPVNIYDSLAANAQGYVAKDVEVVFEEAYKTVLPNFETMRNYLTAKALYDGNIDTFAEVDAFISAYYGPAASAMESYFDSFLANLRAFESKGDYYKSFNAAQFLNGDKYYSPAIIADNYSKTYVDSCKAYFDTAYSALSQAYATDSAEYATYKERIDLEYLGVLYLYLELYADQLTQEQGAEMAQQVFNIVNTSDVTIISGDKINAWRAQFNVVPDGIDYTFFQDKIFDDTSKNRECLYRSFTGEVGGKNINGVKITSDDYQPHFHFTEDAIAMIQAYAEKNGYDMLKINAYAILTDNSFVINKQLYVTSAWKSLNVPVAELSTAFDFWSQSQGATEIYMTFEFYTAPVIDASSFTNVAPDGTNYNITISDYEGTLLDVPFRGIYAASNAYQPSFYFKESAITEIKAYAEANNYDTLRMYVCVTGSGYNLVLNGKVYGVNSAWRSLDIPVADLTTSFRFKSTGDSSKLTRGYLYFEFIHTHSYESVVTAPTCTEQGYTTHTCACGESYVDTYVAATHSYEDGICAACGAVEPIIKPSSFAAMDSSKPYSFENYTGTVAGVDITGIKATSSAYQPKFAFTADAISQIQAYAEKNGYDMLKINAYAIVKDNGFFVNGVYMAKDQWRTTNIAIADLTTSVAFYSQSTGTTEVYLTFEFYTAPVISASSFTNVAPNGNTSAITISDYTGAQLDVEFTGIKASSGAVYQPTFYFTEEGIAKIQAYAKKNNYNNLRIYVCVSGSGYNLVLNNKAWGVNSEWRYLDVAIADLTTSFYFRSTNSNAATNAYLRFEFTNEEVITNTSFAGNFTFAQYEGVVSGKEFKGIKAVGNGVYQPKLWFNDAAITAIKKNAELLGYDALKINVCALLTNNSMLVDKMFYVGDTWKTITVSVEDLSTSLIFHSLSEGTSEIYMSFEFCNMTDYVEGYNVSLGDDIGVNFCLNMTEEEKSSAKIKVNIAGKLQPEIAASALTVKDGAPVLSVNVAAAQMTDIISVGYANGSDFVLIGKYTVREYADYILANDYNDETKNLVKAMLVYGGAAQTYFDYNTGVGANLDIKVEMQTVPTETEAMAVNGAVDGLSFYGASMLFTSKNTVRYYFTLADGADIASYTFTSNGQPLTAIEKDGMYYVEVADINPQDLDDAVEVAVTCADQTLTVAYSPMNYIVRMYNKETTSDNLKALLAAMYTYHVAAEVLYPDAQ